MSTEPENPGPSDRPPPPGQFRPAEPAPPGSYQPRPGGSAESEFYGEYDRTAALDRTNLPGILLITVGVFNVLFGLYMACNALYWYRMSLADTEKALAQAQQMPWLRAYLASGKAQLPTAAEMKSQATVSCTISATVWLVTALLVIMGGARLRTLRSYGLAVSGSLIAIVPCVTCTACCGFGEIVGVWALMVLLNPEVRAAFR